MGSLIEDNSLVLFQGDSITDASRNRENDDLLGAGYVNMVAAQFSALYPEKNVRFLNRGIGGNKAKDLRARWQKDCLDLKPDWISILIGINDCWRRYDSNVITTAEEYESNYRWILQQVREHLDAKIILCEPFVLPYPADRKSWREDLDPKIHVARELAREFDAIYIPLDGIFAQASTRKGPDFWSRDGVHPSPAGHALIAKAWLQAVHAI